MFKVKGIINLYGNWRIGRGTEIGAYCDIGGDIGDNCNIQAGVVIPPLTFIRNQVFIGANTVFTNDKYIDGGLHGVRVLQGAKIGANCTILPGIKIGKRAIIGAGSVVTKSVPDGETWVGNPARKI